MLRPAPAIDVRPLLEEERAELIALLRELGEEGSAARTACTPWTVKGIAAHLLGNDISMLSSGRDGFDDPSKVSPAGGEGLLEWLDERNQRWVGAAAFLSVGTICDLLEATGSLTYAFFTELEAHEPGSTVSWAGEGPHPNWLRIGREFTERWIHQQQIRDAVSKPGLNGPRFVTPLLGLLLRSLPVAYQDVEAPDESAIAVLVDGRAGRPFAIRRIVDGWELCEGRDQEVAASITIDQDTLWRFLSRNISARQARSQAEATGPKKLTDPFFTAVSAIVRT